MTKIYIYCLFDMDALVGVYSSLKAIHRDALRLANRSSSRVMMFIDGVPSEPSLTVLRNTFKGKCDLDIKYRTNNSLIRIYKTKLKE